jgi:hypothetical protein
MESSMLVLGLIVAAAALIIGAWAPGRDGQQLRPVRRITSRLTSADELSRPVAEHHDAGVWAAAGDGRQDGSVDHP